MNATRLTSSVAMIAMLGLCSIGCLEHEVKTTIKSDGSCERVIILKSGSRQVPDTPFPLPTDASWDTSWTPVEGKGTEYQFTMKKQFGDLADLEKEYSSARPGKIDVRVQVRKKFRWFYTYFEYMESYGQYTQYTLVPPTVVMTEEEITRYTYGDTSRVLQNKKDEWVARNLFEIINKAMMGGARSLGDSTLTPVLIAARKEELFRTITGLSGPGEKMLNPDENPALSRYQQGLGGLFEGDSIKESGLDTFVDLLNDVYGISSAGRLKDSLRTGWKEFRGQMKIEQKGGESFKSAVALPGILLETNATHVEGATAAWSFDIERISLHAYEMRAESRIVNVWAIWVTGLGVLGLLGVLVVPLFRRAGDARRQLHLGLLG